MYNPLVEAVESGKGKEIIVGCLERVYEPQGKLFIPTEFYCVSAFVDGKRIENILVEVRDEGTTFNEACKELERMVKDAKGQGFNMEYKGPKTAREKLAQAYDLKPFELERMKNRMTFQARLDWDDMVSLKSLKTRVKI